MIVVIANSYDRDNNDDDAINEIKKYTTSLLVTSSDILHTLPKYMDRTIREKEREGQRKREREREREG